jgi:acetyl-CoA C-acetyltransferase
MRKTLILGASRTPIGAFRGSFSEMSPVNLAQVCSTETLVRADLKPEQVDEVIFGQVLLAGHGLNPARQLLLELAIPNTVPAFTINMACASGMKALEMGWHKIQLNQADVVLAGGMENMTLAPYLLPAMRDGASMGDTQAIDSLVRDGLSDPLGRYHMGITAENLAEKYKITRQAQDQFAYDSQQKCAIAMRSDRFQDEITPVTAQIRRKEVLVDKDQHPRPDTPLEKLARLKPAFKPDGTVTAANASGVNDGAASLLLVAEDSPLAKDANLSLAVHLRGTAVSGCDPALMGIGPVDAVQRLLEQNNLSLDDIDLWEINEAFAAQALAVQAELKLDESRVNVNGGAIALGHPIGASGARIVVTLIHEMKKQGARLGVATLCVGGGMGMAILIENC